MEINWEEVLKSPELTELVFKNSGLSKEEWNKNIDYKNYDKAHNALHDILCDSKNCFKAICDPRGYGYSFRITKVCELYFYYNDSPLEERWEGPTTSLESLYNIPFFACAQGVDNIDYKITSSLDDETVFKILGECDCPITLNGLSYIHNRTRYVLEE